MSKLNDILFERVANTARKHIRAEVRELMHAIIERTYGEAIDMDHMREKLNEAIDEL